MTNNHVADAAKRITEVLAENSVTIRLEEVVNLIDAAANQTIDLVESSMPMTEIITKDCINVAKQLAKNKFKDVDGQIAAFLDNVINALSAVHHNLEEILMSQKNQYTTAMVVNKFIDDLKGLDLELQEMVDASCKAQLHYEINT